METSQGLSNLNLEAGARRYHSTGLAKENAGGVDSEADWVEISGLSALMTTITTVEDALFSRRRLTRMRALPMDSAKACRSSGVPSAPLNEILTFGAKVKLASSTPRGGNVIVTEVSVADLSQPF